MTESLCPTLTFGYVLELRSVELLRLCWKNAVKCQPFLLQVSQQHKCLWQFVFSSMIGSCSQSVVILTQFIKKYEKQRQMCYCQHHSQYALHYCLQGGAAIYNNKKENSWMDKIHWTIGITACNHKKWEKKEIAISSPLRYELYRK